MKNAQLQWTTLTWITAAAFLVFLLVLFSPLLERAIKPLKEDWLPTIIEITTETIDEERIDAGREIPVGRLEYDKESGSTVLIKQEYGQGWNFEVQKTAFDTLSEQYTGPGWLLVYLMSGEEEPQPILKNKKLVDILNFDKLRGSITINGKTYIHTPSEHDYWFEDTNNDGFYQSGEEIETEKFAQIILASLWEEAT